MSNDTICTQSLRNEMHVVDDYGIETGLGLCLGFDFRTLAERVPSKCVGWV